MDDEAMKAMVDRIREEHWPDFDNAVRAAIIETRDRDAAVVESLAMTAADEGEIDLVRTIHAAIRSGQQFRKDV